MSIRIPDLLAQILDATATEAAAKARITGLRAALETEARRRLADDGAAPTWKAPGSGTVRLDPPGEWTATIVDPDAFGSFVAQDYTSEATTVVRVPADQAEDALDALRFAGVTVEDTRVEVRPAFTSSYLPTVTVDVDEDADTFVDDKGLLPDGLGKTRSNPDGKLVVTLDRARRTAAVEAAQREADLVVVAATGDAVAKVDANVLGVENGSAVVPSGNVLDLEKLLKDGLERGTSREAPGHREPYVGEGADGARRSANIDREEADCLDRSDPRYDELLASAVRWDAQADALEDAPLTALEAAGNRELLRRIAHDRGIPAGGTKRELAERLHAAGIDPTTVRLTSGI